MNRSLPMLTKGAYAKAVSVNQAIRKKSLINPPWDGFISGFGTFVGIVDLLFPFLKA